MDVLEGVGAVGPFIVALAPGRDVLDGDVRALELCFGDGDVAGQAVGAGRVVNGD